MDRKAKIIWTITEESDWYTAFKVALEERKVQFPVQPSDLKAIMQAAREALKVLKVERRREIASIDGIRGEVAKRLIDNGIFPRNYLEVLRRAPKAEAVKDEIAELKQRIAVLEQREKDLLSQNEGLSHSILELRDALENQPTPMQYLQRAIAETLSMALDMHERKQKPAHVVVPPKEDIPEFERLRRKGFYETPEGQLKKPKFAIVGDLVGSDKAFIQQENGDEADIRYIDAQQKMNGLKMFNANGGRVILWADHSSHTWEMHIKSIGVSFHKHQGTLPQLTQHIRDVVARTRGPK